MFVSLGGIGVTKAGVGVGVGDVIGTKVSGSLVGVKLGLSVAGGTVLEGDGVGVGVPVGVAVGVGVTVGSNKVKGTCVSKDTRSTSSVNGLSGPKMVNLSVIGPPAISAVSQIANNWLSTSWDCSSCIEAQPPGL